MKIAIGSLPPALISVVLALALLVFTVITFLSHSQFRHWPEWLALIVSILIAVAAPQEREEKEEQPPPRGPGPLSGAALPGGGGSAAAPHRARATGAGVSSRGLTAP